LTYMALIITIFVPSLLMYSVLFRVLSFEFFQFPTATNYTTFVAA